MYKIGICDDDKKFLSSINLSTQKYFENSENLTCEISLFSNPDDLILSIEKGTEYDILLLDICMPGITGTELVKELNKTGYSTKIIFMTTSTEYAIEAFSLQVSNYIVKPFEYDVFEKALNNVINELEKQKDRYLTIKTTDGVKRIATSDLIYTEAQANYLVLHLNSKTDERIREKGKTFYNLLCEKNDNFIMNGVSFIVNIDYIRKINSKEILLSNGTVLSIPRGAYPEIKAKYYSYFFDKEE